VSQKIDLGRFWDSAKEVAMLSSTVAKRLGGVDPEDAYMLGLFHDAGIPIMMHHFDDYKEVLRKANDGEIKELTQYEMDHYGIDHASIGYKLAKEWYLGDDMCEAILYHHECDEVFNQDDASTCPSVSLLGILKFAEYIDYELHRGARGDKQTDWETQGDAIMNYLNWSRDDMNELKDDIKDSFG
jgi:HD-like signal output (HDOD) protein